MTVSNNHPADIIPLLDRSCIQVVQMGSTETVSYNEWADYTIQDQTVALEIAEDMLEGDGTHSFSDDFPQEFEIVDMNAFEAQIIQARREMDEK